MYAVIRCHQVLINPYMLLPSWLACTAAAMPCTAELRHFVPDVTVPGFLNLSVSARLASLIAKPLEVSCLSPLSHLAGFMRTRPDACWMCLAVAVTEVLCIDVDAAGVCSAAFVIVADFSDLIRSGAAGIARIAH